MLTAQDGLAARLGADEDDGARLRAELLRVATEWAQAVLPGAQPPVVSLDALSVAARDAFATNPDGPLLVASAEAPRLTPAHARMALGDLEDGADASFGPGMDGGWYLVALAHPHQALIDLLSTPVYGMDLMAGTFELVETYGLEVGLLRMERLLRTPRDAAALRADPLTPEGVRSALARMG